LLLSIVEFRFLCIGRSVVHSCKEVDCVQLYNQVQPDRVMGASCCKKQAGEQPKPKPARGDVDESELRAVFNEFDLNKDGHIQLNELRSVMIKMGKSPSDEELKAMFKAADADGDGNIDFNEFKTIAKVNPTGLSLRAVFDEMDADGDGVLSRSELRSAFQKMGHNISDEQLKAIYRQVDKDYDGRISFSEFVTMMTKENGGA